MLDPNGYWRGQIGLTASLRARFLRLVLAGVALVATDAQAFDFTVDKPLVSVGDVVQITFRNNNLSLPGQLEFTYFLPAAARYVPNSVRSNGIGIPDNDPRVSVTSQSVRISVFSLTGLTTLTLQIRATGAIGQPIHHRANTGGIVPAQTLRLHPTRIEDETATMLVPDALADARLQEANPTWNFGQSTTLAVSARTGVRANSLLRFDLQGVIGPVPIGWGVQAAYLELYPHARQGSGTLQVRPVTQDWVEGTMSGGPCIGGATWTTANCVTPWPGGGKFDSAIDAVGVDAQSSYVELDVTDYVAGLVGNQIFEYGLGLQATGSTLDLLLPSSESTLDSLVTPRLVIVMAQTDAYEAAAAKTVEAEIIPTQVIAGVGSTRFEYWLKPRIEFEDTGINRISINIPAEYTLGSLDSMWIGGVPYRPGDGNALDPMEYENWGTPSRLDVRFYPAMTWLDGDPPIRLVFRAVPPAVPTPDRPFPSTFDNDRRGQPVRNASEGDANPGAGDEDKWRVRAILTDLVRVEVSPSDTTVAVGQTVPYRAVAVYADSSRFDVSAQATWSVQPVALGTFDSLGVFSAQQSGNGSVGAMWNALPSATASLRVDPPQMVALFLDPASASIAAGDSASFRAVGVLTNGDSLDVTPVAAWSAFDTLTATFVSPGIAVGLSPGATPVEAQYSGFAAAGLLTVTPAELLRIDVAPADTSIALGFGFAYTATGTYTNGQSNDVTGVVTWKSQPPGIVDIGANGYATSQAVGFTQVIAELTGVSSDSASCTVTAPVLVSLDGQPDSATVTVQAFHVVQSWGTYSDGKIANKTAFVTWQSLDPIVADFVSPGTVSALSPGTARLTHELGGIVGDTLLVTVTAATIDSIVVTPRTLFLPPSTDYSLTARGHWSDGSSQIITSQASWSTDNAPVATIDSLGHLTTHSEGSAVLTAWFGGATSACSLTVSTAAFDSLVVSPASSAIPVGLDAAHMAIAYRNASPTDVTASATWSIADSTVAVVDSLGVVTGVAVGSTSLSASFGVLLAAPVAIDVTPPVVTAVAVLPAASTLRLGTSKQLIAQAHMSDGQVQDATPTATWTSLSPSILYVQPDGLALGLSLGTALVTATVDAVTSKTSQLQVLPSVQLEAQAIGSVPVSPGSRNALLLALRLTNHDVEIHTLTALRMEITGPVDSLHLWVDNGDGVFDVMTDTRLRSGKRSQGRWTPTNLNTDVPVGGRRTMFLSADVSLTQAAHGAALNAWVQGHADLFWSTPTATVAQSLPLDSFGQATCQDLVAAQIDFQVLPADTVFPGANEVALLQWTPPDDGGLDDTLTEITVRQLGTATFGTDISSLLLQKKTTTTTETIPHMPKPLSKPPTAPVTQNWQNVAPLVHTGAGRWTVSGISVGIPADAEPQLRVVATLAQGAREGRTLRLQLPASGLAFASGREGPIDAGWSNPNTSIIEAQHQLAVQQTVVAPPSNPISRLASQQVVLGLELTAWSANDDTLTGLRLQHISTGPTGMAVDRDQQIERARLWWDRNSDGRIDIGDLELDLRVPGTIQAGEIRFGATGNLNLPLPAAQPVRLLVSMTPHDTLVRDAENLRVQLQQAQHVETRGGLEVLLPVPLQTLVPPQVNGQELVGYDVRPIDGTVLLSKSTDKVVLDLTLPGNGFENDVLSRLRVDNLGDATASDIARMRLWRDNGNGAFDAGDSLAATLANIANRSWEASGISVPVRAGDLRRWFVTVDIAATAQSSRTIQASIPINGVQVVSGNDGPIDMAALGGEPHVISEPNRVTWLAGVDVGISVPPDASRQVILVLEGYNGYATTQTLRSLQVAKRGTAAEQEFQLWRLHADSNSNGELDDGDATLAIAPLAAGKIDFSGFAWDMQPQQHQRLLVSYSLSQMSARDASVINAVIESAASFGYEQGTLSIGSFELDSPGVDRVDGMIRRQITHVGIAPRSLGGGETNVLALDLVVPSNGWQGDTLQALQVQLGATPPAAVYGVDVLDVKLWRESDAATQSSQFDPATDVFLERAVQNGNALLFAGLNSILPAGGHRFYVTVDLAANPTDGARIQVQLPTNGITMRSGNDGPRDEGIVDGVVHTVSSSDLLASVEVQPLLVSRNQEIALNVSVRNQGSAQIDSVTIVQLLVDPPGAASLVSGPTPVFVSLAPDAVGAFAYTFRMLAAGPVQFTVVAGEWNGPRQSDPAASPVMHVEEPPSGLALAPLSSLPPSVNRGQIGLTPLIWRLTHPDPDSMAADISIDTLRVHVRDGNGVPQLATQVLTALEVRTGGLVHASWSSMPNDSVLTVPLGVPVTLTAGEQRDLPLTVAIASDASASAFRLHLQGAGAIDATDANSGAPVVLVANLPWSTQSASILTPSTSIEVLPTATLPAGINRGQQAVAAGSLTFVLPGAPGESEARVTRLALAFEAAGQPLVPRDLFTRVRVRHGTTTLLDLQDLASSGNVQTLQLAIPKVVASGDSVRLDLSFDMLGAIATSELQVILPDSSAIEVRDANSGAPVDVTLAGDTFPWTQGPAQVQQPAQMLSAQVTPTAPGSTFPAATQMPILEVALVNGDPPGAADMRIESLGFEVLDELGNALSPTSVVGTARWLDGTSVVAQTSVGAGLRMLLQPAVAPTLSPGETLRVALQVDLTPTLSEPWVRFHLPGNALVVSDANDASQSIATMGLPSSTGLVQVVAEAAAVAFGALEHPPANVVPGASAATLLHMRIAHAGAANEADIAAERLVVRLRDAASQSLLTSQVLTAATVTWDTTTAVGTVAGDSLVFDLSAMPHIAAGSGRDVAMHFDMASVVAVSDFRLALDAGAVTATSGGGTPLAVQALGSLGLPYVSPTIHVSSTSLEASFASYPNPFTPAQGPCNITFFLVADARVTCDVYTLSGQRVIRLLDAQPRTSGLQDDVTWDGRNERGETVRNGTYLLRIQVDGGGEFYRKLAVIR